MKSIVGWSVIVALLVLIIGCGGGGGGGGTGSGTTSSNGSTGGGLHAFQITAYQTSGAMLDARNMVAGETLQLMLTARDVHENLVQISTTGWTTSAPAGVATVSSGGQLTGVSASATAYSIQVTYSGIVYQAPLTVSAPQDILTGIVRNTVNPIEDAVVDFYDGSSKAVGSAYTARDGTFRASLPSTAVRFTLDMSLADPGNTLYFNEYTYTPASTPFVYLEDTSCLAQLGVTLSSAGPTALPNPIVPYVRSGSSPPPPPNGCLG